MRIHYSEGNFFKCPKLGTGRFDAAHEHSSMQVRRNKAGQIKFLAIIKIKNHDLNFIQ